MGATLSQNKTNTLLHLGLTVLHYNSLGLTVLHYSLGLTVLHYSLGSTA